MTNRSLMTSARAAWWLAGKIYSSTRRARLVMSMAFIFLLLRRVGAAVQY